MNERQRIPDPKGSRRNLWNRARTLANWRCQGRGPAYVKSGRKVLYKRTMIDHFLYNQRVLTNDFDEEEFMCHFEAAITDPEIPF